MHLLYLDDAGSVKNPNEQYLMLGGVSVFEAQSHWVTQELDQLAGCIDPVDPHGVEFHASEIFSRRSLPWKGMKRDQARATIKAVLQVLTKSYETARAFACVVHKDSFPNQDPMEIAFEDLCKRFDLFLERVNANQDGDTQRGLLILDKTTYETTLQQLALKFRTLGTHWGVIQNIADTPLFVNSQASRVIQLADHVAYSVFRLYQANDTQYFNVIASRFDSEEGKIHGLVHKERDNPTCMCIACFSRRYAAQ